MDVAAGRRFPATIRPHESAAHGRLWTGQREGDVPRLKWSAYDGQVIRLKQRWATPRPEEERQRDRRHRLP
jgi:hypothetical protein